MTDQNSDKDSLGKVKEISFMQVAVKPKECRSYSSCIIILAPKGCATDNIAKGAT